MTSTKPSITFWIVSVLALIWNLMGVMAFIDQVTMTPKATDIPLWAMVAFGIAVCGSTLGCILLLLRKRLAAPVLSIAFAGILVQMVHSLVLSKSIEVYGPGDIAMPIMIILIGGFLIWYSRKAVTLGWLN